MGLDYPREICASTFKNMNVTELKKMCAKLHEKKKVYRKVRDKSITAQTIPAEYILTFGKFKGEKISNVPPHYLEWIVTNITNRPDVVELVAQYLSQLPASGLAKRISNMSALRRPLSPLAAVAEGDILFTAYPFPDFKHPLENATYGGTPLMEFHLSDLENILERDPDNEELKDFVAHRHCHFFRWYVFDQYKKALSIDTSKLDGEGLLQYEEVMDVCREIQNVIDTVRDVECCKGILFSRFACIHRMKLPGSA